MDEKGFAVIGSAVIVALAVFMGFGAAVIIQRNSLLHQAKLSQHRMARSVHEDLTLTVDRNPDNTEILLRNTGSTPLIADVLLLRRPDNSLDAREQLGGSGDVLPLGIMENGGFTVGENVGENEVGVATRLGNVFWEV